MTRFRILTKDESGKWSEAGTEEAHSSAAAVVKAYMKAPAPEILSIVGVPFRSWKPTAIRLEKTERVVLGEEPEVTPESRKA